jgi:hypothetical protein
VNNFNEFARLVVPKIILTKSSASNKKGESPSSGSKVYLQRMNIQLLLILKQEKLFFC